MKQEFADIYEVLKHAFVFLDEDRSHPIYRDWFQHIADVYGVDRWEAEEAYLRLVDEGIIPNPIYGYGYVYVLGSMELGYYKIGKANDIDKRVKQLKIQIPFSVRVVREVHVSQPYKVERFFHEMFADCRMNGEWFRLTEDQLLLVDHRSIPAAISEGEMYA